MQNTLKSNGLPADSSINRLLYNFPSNTLIAEAAEPLQGRFTVGRLYYRRLPSAEYLPVSVEDCLDTQWDAISCASAPAIIYNQLRYRHADGAAEHIGADWSSVRRFDLLAGQISVVVSPESLRLPENYIRGWVSHILMPWPDGKGAACTLALERETGAGCSVVDYRVYDLSFEQGLLQELAILPDVFA